MVALAEDAILIRLVEVTVTAVDVEIVDMERIGEGERPEGEFDRGRGGNYIAGRILDGSEPSVLASKGRAIAREIMEAVAESAVIPRKLGREGQVEDRDRFDVEEGADEIVGGRQRICESDIDFRGLPKDALPNVERHAIDKLRAQLETQGL